MLGYVCKYTPLEIIEALGEEAVKIEPRGKSPASAHIFTHVNMCSYMKGILDAILEQDIRKVVLVNCCDSIRRLYDILRDKTDFIYLIDLPRKINAASCRLFAREIYNFARALEKHQGVTMNMDRLLEIVRSHLPADIPAENSLVILGGRFQENLLDEITSRYKMTTVNLTCSGGNRLSPLETDPERGENDFILTYAGALLRSLPCLRMAEDRQALLENLSARGVIYNTIKFCDFYSFEYAGLKKSLKLPLLKLETDHTDANSGQLLTRIDAFLEMLDKKRMPLKARKKHFFAGIDSGSTSTNAVIIDNSRSVISYSIVPTGAKAVESAGEALRIALGKAGLQQEDLSCIVATGYGRVSIPFADTVTTEISCHGKGAFCLDERVRTIIDIGGQDSKVIRLDEKGNVLDFVMNDKCSAGTGRFLDFMAKALEISIEDISKVVLDYKEDIVITTMCTVFAESEVISLVANNKDERDIIRGLNRSVAAKAVSLLNRLKHEERYMMTGGVAKNNSVVHELEQKIGKRLIVPAEPQIIGALGAAILALESTY